MSVRLIHGLITCRRTDASNEKYGNDPRGLQSEAVVTHSEVIFSHLLGETEVNHRLYVNLFGLYMLMSLVYFQGTFFPLTSRFNQQNQE